MKVSIPSTPLARFLAAAIGAALVGGCLHHDVDLQGSDWHYATGSPRIERAITVVIDPATVNEKVPIHSVATGIANSWDVQPGEMLRQVAQVELPQMFADCRIVETAPSPPAEGALVLTLAIDHYAFEDFQARLTLHANATTADGRLLFDKLYSSVGPKQGGKMMLAGAFGMKSAVRQSSLAAFKTVFAGLRADLARAAQTGGTTAPPGGVY